MSFRACLVSAMGLLAASAPAHASFYLIDLTGNGGAATSMDFIIAPNATQQLHATPLPGATNVPFVGSVASLLTQTSGGIGVRTALDVNGEIDNYTIQEGIRFTLTAGPVTNFRLAAIEFSGIDNGIPFLLDSDEYRLRVNNSTSVGASDIPCGASGNDTCWVRFLNISGLGVGVDGTDNVSGSPGILGTQFDVMTTNISFSEFNDDWRIRRLVWEIDDLVTTPEPAAMTLFCAGLLGLGMARQRRQR